MQQTVTPDNLVNRTFNSAGGLALPYRLHVPLDYLQSKKYPLLLVMHGSGERGNDNRKQLINGVLAFCEPALQRTHASFVVYPQCPAGSSWVDLTAPDATYDLTRIPLSKPLSAALELLAALEKEFSIDPHRRLVAGLSMGGYGTWDAILRYPERFAGAMPICGGGDPRQAAAARQIPVWAFHGGDDKVVPVSASRSMVQALRKAGGRVRYTEYPGVGHNSWDKTFADRRALAWLLEQRRKPSSTGTGTGTGTGKGGSR